MGITFLPDRLRAGGVGSTDGDGAGVACGDDGGVTKFSSKSVGRVGGTKISGTFEAGGTSGTATGVVGSDCEGAGTSGAVLAVTGGGGGCVTGEGGEGPGSDGVAEENLRRNCLFLSVTLPLPSTLILYLLKPRSSMTVPERSHLLAILPAPC